MQKTTQLINELKNLGCTTTTEKTKQGYVTKVVFPYTTLKSNLKKFDPNPHIVTYYHGDQECLRLNCCNSPTAYGISDVQTLLRYYAFMTKMYSVGNLPLRCGAVLTGLHTVNTVLRPIDLICWRKGYFSVLVNVNANTVQVISNAIKNATQKTKHFKFRIA